MHGSSIVRWASRFTCQRGGGSSLGLQRNRVHIKWIGISGMEWADMDTALQDHIKIGPPPNIIIIHVGANDLTSVKAKELILNIECSILRLKTLLPSTFLFWSDMLQRLYWHGAKSTVKIEKARKRVNAAARSSFLREGGGYIRHPSISITICRGT